MNLGAIFLTGLLTGGLTCLAVQGGLLAATLATNEEERLKKGLASSGRAAPILAFLIAKLIAYTMLGFLLGWLGSFFQLSLSIRTLLSAVVAVFMIGTALNLLNVHPFFRHFAIETPRFLAKILRDHSRGQGIMGSGSQVFAPALLGAFTVFIPCGTTQAMMALAIASGNPLSGGLILSAFILGTSPIFFILGYFATRLGEFFQKSFAKVAAVTILAMAIFNLNGITAVFGGANIFNDAWTNVFCTVTFCRSAVSANSNNGSTATEAEIRINRSGYSPSKLTLKAGSSIQLKLINEGGAGCASAFTIPSLGIEQVVPPGQTKLVSFVVPTGVTQIPFMCSMGMVRGMFNII